MCLNLQKENHWARAGFAASGKEKAQGRVITPGVNFDETDDDP